MELRTTFNEDACNYDRARPDYAPALFDAIFAYRAVDRHSRALEIGIGTGQATGPVLATGCHVTAAELGGDLAAFSREKFAAHDNFSVLHGDFMQLELPESGFDLIYSATAFHWLPQQEAYAKALRLLKPGGAIALFWNHPYPNRPEDPTNAVNRCIYARHRPGGGEIKEGTDTAPRIAAMIEAGFADVQAQLFHRVRTLSTEQYIALINTYSDHRALPAEKRAAFEQDMRERLAEVGGCINIYDTMSLYLGRKQE